MSVSEKTYKDLQADVNSTKQILFSHRDRIFEFQIEYPDKETVTLRFRRLRASEFDHVTDAINQVGLVTEQDFKAASKDKLKQLYLCYCLALGYASADELNAQDFSELDDKFLVQIEANKPKSFI